MVMILVLQPIKESMNLIKRIESRKQQDEFRQHLAENLIKRIESKNPPIPVPMAVAANLIKRIERVMRLKLNTPNTKRIS